MRPRPSSVRHMLRKKSTVAAASQEISFLAPPLDVSTLNPGVVDCAYAVRGRIVDEAARLSTRMAKGEVFPFKKLVPMNIGNPHALEQRPLTFQRQVISQCLYPSAPEEAASLPADTVERARRYVGGAGASGMGAYTDTQGLVEVRRDVAEFLFRRDGHRADPGKIFLTNGASEGVRLVMQSLLRPPAPGALGDGVLTPIPQYPLYSALLSLGGGELVPYYLDEARDWAVPADELRAALDEARSRGVVVRAVVVINPGNPTGNVLSESDVRDIIQLAVEERLVVMADEVYQENVWDTSRPFHSFKKVACDMGYHGAPGDDRLHLVSFHSTSKGFVGECGLRGGYMELHGFPAGVTAQLLKLAGISLCANTVGQVATGLMVNPPRPGEPSEPLYCKERDAVLGSLRRRSRRLAETLGRLPGISCTAPQGALYAFPQISLGPRAVAAAAAEGVAPDEHYCLWMLQKAGIMLVPGSGFGQRDGTWHLRLTCLPPEESFGEVEAAIAKAHGSYMEAYRD